MRIRSHRGAAVCIGGAAAAMAVCGGILNYGAAKIMSPGEAATTLAWAAALSLEGVAAGVSVGKRALAREAAEFDRKRCLNTKGGASTQN